LVFVGGAGVVPAGGFGARLVGGVSWAA
jgi:hypothetical protein